MKVKVGITVTKTTEVVIDIDDDDYADWLGDGVDNPENLREYIESDQDWPYDNVLDQVRHNSLHDFWTDIDHVEVL